MLLFNLNSVYSIDCNYIMQSTVTNGIVLLHLTGITATLRGLYCFCYVFFFILFERSVYSAKCFFFCFFFQLILTPFFMHPNTSKTLVVGDIALYIECFTIAE